MGTRLYKWNRFPLLIYEGGDDVEEFEKLLRDKRSAYSEYRKAQSEMKELAIHKANAGFILDIKEEKTKTPVQHKRKEK